VYSDKTQVVLIQLILKMSTRAVVVEEGAKVSRNYHVVIVFMWNLWNVTKCFHAIVKAQHFFVFPAETLGRAQPETLLDSVKK